MTRNQDVFRYQIRNWCDSNRALANRGRLTVRFDEAAITAWDNTDSAQGLGVPRIWHQNPLCEPAFGKCFTRSEVG